MTRQLRLITVPPSWDGVRTRGRSRLHVPCVSGIYRGGKSAAEEGRLLGDWRRYAPVSGWPPDPTNCPRPAGPVSPWPSSWRGCRPTSRRRRYATRPPRRDLALDRLRHLYGPPIIVLEGVPGLGRETAPPVQQHSQRLNAWFAWQIPDDLEQHMHCRDGGRVQRPAMVVADGVDKPANRQGGTVSRHRRRQSLDSASGRLRPVPGRPRHCGPIQRRPRVHRTSVRTTSRLSGIVPASPCGSHPECTWARTTREVG